MGFGQECKEFCLASAVHLGPPRKQWQRKAKRQCILGPELIGLVCWIGAQSLDCRSKELLPWSCSCEREEPRHREGQHWMNNMHQEKEEEQWADY